MPCSITGVANTLQAVDIIAKAARIFKPDFINIENSLITVGRLLKEGLIKKPLYDASVNDIRNIFEA
jgi:hypothetical protein